MKRTLILLSTILIMKTALFPSIDGGAGRETPHPRFSLYVTIHSVHPFMDTETRHQYSPPLLAGLYESSAAQSLHVKAGNSWGWSAGFTVYLSKSFGIQARLDRFRLPLSGTNSPYAFEIDYVAHPPPDYSPQIQHFERTEIWPDTEGSLRILSFSWNGIVLLHLTQSLSFEGSGGMSLFWIKGELASWGYTKFWLGGHSVLFFETYKIKSRFFYPEGLGFNLGGSLRCRLNRTIGLTLGGHFFFPLKIRAGLIPSEIVNRKEVVLVDDLDTITRKLALSPLELRPVFITLSAGLVVWF